MTFNGTPVDLKNFENVDVLGSAYMEFAEQVRTIKIKGKTLSETLLHYNSPE